MLPTYLFVLHTYLKVQKQAVQILVWGMNSNNTILHLKLHYIKHYGETTFDSKDIWAIKKKHNPDNSFPKQSNASLKHYEELFDSSHFHKKVISFL